MENRFNHENTYIKSLDRDSSNLFDGMSFLIIESILMLWNHESLKIRIAMAIITVQVYVHKLHRKIQCEIIGNKEAARTWKSNQPDE